MINEWVVTFGSKVGYMQGTWSIWANVPATARDLPHPLLPRYTFQVCCRAVLPRYTTLKLSCEPRSLSRYCVEYLCTACEPVWTLPRYRRLSRHISTCWWLKDGTRRESLQSLQHWPFVRYSGNTTVFSGLIRLVLPISENRSLEPLMSHIFFLDVHWDQQDKEDQDNLRMVSVQRIRVWELHKYWQEIPLPLGRLFRSLLK